MSSVAVEADLRDLVFELSETGATKLCISICNSSGARQDLLRHVSAELNRIGVSDFQIHLPTTDLDVAKTLQERIHADNVKVAHLLGFDELTSNLCDEVFANLNFRRDFLLRLGIPICLWISTRLLSRLVAVAPDFWSRRTATYYFTSPSVEKLLSRLFGSSKPTGPATEESTRIGQAVARIVLYERELNKEYHSSLAASQASSLVALIRDEVEVLIASCERNQQFLVTLALWNESQADVYVQRQFFKLRIPTRTAVEKIYDDKNDVLFDMTRQVRNILINYRDKLEKRFLKGERISLLRYFMRYAKHSLQDLFEAAGREAKWQLPLAALRREDEVGSSLDEQLRIEAVYRLESALLHEDEGAPEVFSGCELEALRELYSAKQPKRLFRRMQKRLGAGGLDRLQAKVRAFLEDATP